MDKIEYRKEQRIKKLNEERPFLCTRKIINRCREVRFYNPQGTRCFWAWKSSGEKVWNIRYGAVVISKESDFSDKYILTMSSKCQYNQSANGTIIPRKVESRNQVMEIAGQIGTLITK